MELPNFIIDKIYKINYDKNISVVMNELSKDRPIFPGDFFWHPDEFMQEEGPIAYRIICEMDGWEIMKVDPPEDVGYMCWNNREVNKIMIKIDKISNNHSGASLSFMMRHMNYIAKNGWVSYYEKFRLKD
jgi:hypothetical protein